MLSWLRSPNRPMFQVKRSQTRINQSQLVATEVRKCQSCFFCSTGQSFVKYIRLETRSAVSDSWKLGPGSSLNMNHSMSVFTSKPKPCQRILWNTDVFVDVSWWLLHLLCNPNLDPIYESVFMKHMKVISLPPYQQEHLLPNFSLFLLFSPRAFNFPVISTVTIDYHVPDFVRSL